LLQTDNHASTPPLSFLQAGCPSCRPTNSVKALKAQARQDNYYNSSQSLQDFIMGNGLVYHLPVYRESKFLYYQHDFGTDSF